jgi:SAM-dependent methyltransferase
MTMGNADVQGALWGAAPEDWAELVEPQSAPLYEAVLDALGVTAGRSYFDAGCGSGLALELARDRGATVAGLDAAAGLLDVARRRVPDGEIRHGDLEALPFPPNSFDAVTAFNSVQYAADPVAALREIARVARSGAPVGIATWGAAEQCETRTVLAAIGGLLPPPPPGAGGPFALSEPGKLEDLAVTAGLAPTQATDIAIAFEFADLDTALRGHLSSGPARRAIDVAGRGAVDAALRAALEPSLRADGSSHQANVFRYLIANGPTRAAERSRSSRGRARPDRPVD